MTLLEQEEGFVPLDPVAHLKSITGLTDEATDQEIEDWIAEGGPSHAYTKIQERLA